MYSWAFFTVFVEQRHKVLRMRRKRTLRRESPNGEKPYRQPKQNWRQTRFVAISLISHKQQERKIRKYSLCTSSHSTTATKLISQCTFWCKLIRRVCGENQGQHNGTETTDTVSVEKSRPKCAAPPTLNIWKFI